MPSEPPDVLVVRQELEGLERVAALERVGREVRDGSSVSATWRGQQVDEVRRERETPGTGLVPRVVVVGEPALRDAVRAAHVHLRAGTRCPAPGRGSSAAPASCTRYSSRCPPSSLTSAGDVVPGVLGAAAHAGVGLVRERLVAVQLLLEVEHPALLKLRGHERGVREDGQRLVQRRETSASPARWPARRRPTAG